MKKRILAVVMSVIMLLGLIPLTAFADAEAKVTFTTVVDKEVVAPGDTVEFSLYAQATELTAGWNFELIIPEGLTYVAGSGKLPEGIQTTIGATGPGEVCMFTESSKVHSVAAGLMSGTGATNLYDEPLLILTYECTVDADAAEGEYEATIGGADMDVMDNSFASITSDCAFVGATVTVEYPPKVTFTTTANKESAAIGSTVEFSVYAQAAELTAGWNFELIIPDGLTYVAGSGKLPEGIQTTIGATGPGEVCMFTESSKVHSVAAGLMSGTGATNLYDEPLLILTYECTVDADAALGDYEVTLGGADMDVMDNSFASIKDDTKIVAATVTVVDHVCTPDMLTAVEAVDATCTEDGNVAYYVCNECGIKYANADATQEIGDVIIPATGHTDGEWKVTTPATCDEAGVETLYCAVCEEEIGTREIPATGHNYEPVVTDPTCTEGGYTTYTCSVCGDSYKDDEVDATGHTDGEWKVTTPATCDEAGVETLYCAVCEEEIGTREIPATGHNYEPVVTDPTCTEGGYTTYTCSVCGDSYEDDEVDATGHTDGEWKVTTPATCTTAGVETLYCAVCEAEIGTKEIPATGHTDGEWKVTTPATCDEAGVETLYCAVCEEEIGTREIPATGHNYEPAVTAPTCTEAGYTTYTCACGDSYEADAVAATGHDDSGVYVEDPANPGTWYLYCANDCGEILDEDIRTIFVDGIKLDQDNVVTKYIRKSPAFTLTAFINPEEATENYKITWTSSNEKVATVDEDGNVTTHKRGTAVITATVEKADGTTYSASCNVKVKYTFCQWLIWFFLLGCLWYFV